MEDIVHFKYVDEQYWVKELIKVEQPRSSTLPLFVESKEIRSEPQVSWEFITQDEFKKYLGENKEVNTSRVTYIVSEDLTKNTISLKCFKFSKRTVIVKNLKRRRFKINYHNIFSLTVNKTTGEFSTYHKTYARRKYYCMIRKNIITERLKNLLRTYFLTAMNNDSFGAVPVFYKLLGYEPLITYKQFMNEYLPPKSQDFFDPRITDSISSFPFLNYLIKSGIKDLSFELLPMVEYIFKQDKKKFFNKSIIEYIKHYYNIKNDVLLESVFNQLTVTNYNTRELHSVAYKTTDNKSGYEFYTPGINMGVINLIDRYNIPNEKYKDICLTTTNFYFDSTNEYKSIPHYVHKMVDYYGFKIYEILDYYIQNRGNCMRTFKFLYVFHMFGIKFKIERAIDFLVTGSNIFMIFDALCYSRGETGVIQLNHSLVETLKNSLPSGYELRIKHSTKPNKAAFYDEITVIRTDDDKYTRIYNIKSPAPLINVIDVVNKQIVVKTTLDLFEPILVSTNGGLDSYTQAVISLYDKNQIFVKQIYSKSYFEDHLLKTYGLVASDFLVYTD